MRPQFQASGSNLTVLGMVFGVERRSFLLFFQEPDFMFRRRLRTYLMLKHALDW